MIAEKILIEYCTVKAYLTYYKLSISNLSIGNMTIR